MVLRDDSFGKSRLCNICHNIAGRGPALVPHAQACSSPRVLHALGSVTYDDVSTFCPITTLHHSAMPIKGNPAVSNVVVPRLCVKILKLPRLGVKTIARDRG